MPGTLVLCGGRACVRTGPGPAAAQLPSGALTSTGGQDRPHSSTVTLPCHAASRTNALVQGQRQTTAHFSGKTRRRKTHSRCETVKGRIQSSMRPHHNTKPYTLRGKFTERFAVRHGQDTATAS
ncbi:hypothetical protein AAFF_G00184870 [Aldrovandia affinis]|uniref:Uncharacterized protein n=1 Tax=Aldrovandia affinis TaxID=143900 RepID=A0AAD7RJY9_9TELE|nr:hypothetical protein AAFF_G00184870 [Aldrovandia affinis]